MNVDGFQIHNFNQANELKEYTPKPALIEKIYSENLQIMYFTCLK